MGKYHVRKNSSSQYYFHLKGDNNEIILQSEMYTTKGAAYGGISSCKENSPHDDRYTRFGSHDGQYTFTLVARNGERIGRGETYPTTQAREVGIASCKKNGPTSSTQDDTGER